jgi:hypothetical protein
MKNHEEQKRIIRYVFLRILCPHHDFPKSQQNKHTNPVTLLHPIKTQAYGDIHAYTPSHLTKEKTLKATKRVS